MTRWLGLGQLHQACSQDQSAQALHSSNRGNDTDNVNASRGLSIQSTGGARGGEGGGEATGPTHDETASPWILWCMLLVPAADGQGSKTV